MTTRTKLSAIFLVLVWPAVVLPNGFSQTSDLHGDVLIRVDGSPALGEKTAKVTVVEFSDYQCPRSSQYFNQTMKPLVDEYVKTGKAKYVFRDFPLESIHPRALQAAEGAHCAGEQGQYWQMHDRFFRNPMAIAAQVLPLHAAMLGLNVAKFQQCLDSSKYAAQIRDSVAAGKKAGVQGTPWFFLGLTDTGQPDVRALAFVEGAQPYRVFQQAIDRLLSLPGRPSSPQDTSSASLSAR